MSRELDAAIAAAHVPVEPVSVPKQATKSPAKKVGAPTVTAPAVKVDKSGHRVRLRGIDHTLPICLSFEGKQELRMELQPNRWVEVPDEVYALLKSKFYKPRKTQVVDWNGDPDNPIRQIRTEETLGYIIEFPEEVDNG